MSFGPRREVVEAAAMASAKQAAEESSATRWLGVTSPTQTHTMYTRYGDNCRGYLNGAIRIRTSGMPTRNTGHPMWILLSDLMVLSKAMSTLDSEDSNPDRTLLMPKKISR